MHTCIIGSACSVSIFTLIVPQRAKKYNSAIRWIRDYSHIMMIMHIWNFAIKETVNYELLNSALDCVTNASSASQRNVLHMLLLLY